MFNKACKTSIHSVPAPFDDAILSLPDFSPISDILPTFKALLQDDSIKEITGYNNEIVFCKLLLIYSLRYSELRRVTIDDYIEPDRLICKGSKKGASTIIYVPGLSVVMCEIKEKMYSEIFQGLSYEHIHKIMRKLNVTGKYTFGKNAAASHIGRKNVDKITNGKLSELQLSDILRQRVVKNSVFYRYNQMPENKKIILPGRLKNKKGDVIL